MPGLPGFALMHEPRGAGPKEAKKLFVGQAAAL